jgi:hypothetical protein
MLLLVVYCLFVVEECGPLLQISSIENTISSIAHASWTHFFHTSSTSTPDHLFTQVVNLEPEELPTSDSVDFVVDPAPAQSKDEQTIVFCIDISGSMCVTTEVARNTKLTKTSVRENAVLRAHAEGDQFLPGENRNVDYVSRLQCIQAAIEHHITEVARYAPLLGYVMSYTVVCFLSSILLFSIIIYHSNSFYCILLYSIVFH